MTAKLDNAIALYMKGIRDGNARHAVETYTGDRYTQHSTGVRDGVVAHDPRVLEAWHGEFSEEELDVEIGFHMRQVNVSKKINAPRQVIWDILADFANVANWNSGVNESHCTSDAANGVGASRHCDLGPGGGLEQTIRGDVLTDLGQ